jgi:hypothetical protein
VEALVALRDIVAEHLPFEESITNPVISTWTHLAVVSAAPRFSGQ